MADNRTFTLVGKFDDQITKKLKDLNRQLDTLGKFGKRSYDPFKGMSKGIAAANKELDLLEKGIKDLSRQKFKFDKGGIVAAREEVRALGSQIDSIAKRGFHFDKSGIQAASQEVRVLGKEIDSVAQKGFHFDKSGIQAAQQEARVLGDILKANALIQAGQGVAGAGAAGFRGGMAGISKIYGFVAARAKDAAQDQLQDVQARGSLFGALNKAELFANAKNITDQKKLQELNEKNYDTTRSISRSMEGAIADVVKSSTVSTATITTLSRQLSDNLLPSMLKAKDVTDLSKFEGPEGRKELDKIMGGEKGVGKELATLYEQMGSIITSPQYAPQAAMGFTQFLGQGTINRQLAIFEQNPVLVDAMKKYAAEFGNTTEGRIKALKKALEVAMPEAALQEARQTLMGGIQSISDTLTNANAGILSMGADIAGQGQKTLEMARKNGTIKLQEAAFERRQGELREKWMKEKARTAKEMADRDKMEAEQRTKFARGLQRLYENADSPIEIIAASFGPLMQKFADFLGSTRNLFIDPVMAIMNRLQPPLAQLMDNLEALGSDVRSGKRTFAEALGRAFAEFFKAIANLFDPKGIAEQGGNAMQKAFQDFAKGFRNAEIDGKKYLDIILEGIKDFLMKAIFNEGDVFKGLTPLGDALAKVFALLAAPAFINALIIGLVPLAIQGMGAMIMGSLKGVMPKVTESLKSLTQRLLPKAQDLTRTAAPAPVNPTSIFRAIKSIATIEIPMVSLRGVLTAIVGLFSNLKGALPGILNFLRYGGGLFKGFGPTITAVVSGFKNFGNLLKTGAKGLGKLGGVLTAIVAAFDFITALMSGKDIAESLGAAAGPALGTVLGFALGGPIGAFIGSWIGGLKPVTDFLTGTFRALGDFFGYFGPTFMSTLEAIGSVFGSLWNVTIGLIPGMNDLGGASGALAAGFYLIKGALLPVAAVLFVLEQAALGLKLGFLMIDQLINNTFQGGNRSGRLSAEIDKTVTAIEKSRGRIVALAASEPPKPKPTGAPKPAAATPASTTPSTPTTPKPPAPPTTPKPPAPPTTPKSDPIQASLRAKAAQDIQWLWKQLTAPRPAATTVKPATAPATPPPPVIPPAVVAANVASVNRMAAANNALAPTTTKVSAANNSMAAASVNSAKKVNDSANKQATTMAKILASWDKTNVSSQAKLASAASGLAAAINGAAAKLKAAGAGIGATPTAPQTTGNEGVQAARKWDGKDRKPVPLDQAIAEEKKNMPSGAHLVIANSTETIIPKDKNPVLNAAEGLNLGGLASGMDKFTAGVNEVGKMADQLGGFGGILGGASGNLALAHALAKTFGLSLTSYKRNGPPNASYHNVGRAMDFSNSTGPTPQMMGFAQAMASKYGGSMAELIYTPLGFGIKHGKQVAPYAASSHYNHVHVAFNKGNVSPLLEEMRAMPSGAKLGVANSSEFVANKKQTKLLATALSGYQEVKSLLKAFVATRSTALLGRQPTVDPLVNQPVVNPFVNQPVVNPLVNQPVVNPFVNQPVVNPLVNQPTVNPLTPSSPPSFTGTQGLGGGPASTENNFTVTVTVNAAPGQDPQAVADAVIGELENRLARVQSSALFF